MSTSHRTQPGTIAWTDLTVPDTEAVRDFYSAVVGWEAQPVDQGSYSDYTMLPPGADAPAAGIIHPLGMNAAIPPVWMVYIVVADLAAALVRCAELGGTVLLGPDQLGAQASHAIIQDPAGAVVALYQPPAG